MPGPAEQQVVVARLETLEALAVDAGEADDLPGEPAGRVDALRLGEDTDAVETELADRDADLVVELAGEVDEVGVARSSRSRGSAASRAEQRRELAARPSRRPRPAGRSRPSGVSRGPEGPRVGVDGRGLDGGGEHVALTVVDAAAVARQLDDPGPLRRAEVGVAGRVDDLDAHELADDDRPRPAGRRRAATAGGGRRCRRRLARAIGRRGRVARRRGSVTVGRRPATVGLAVGGEDGLERVGGVAGQRLGDGAVGRQRPRRGPGAATGRPGRGRARAAAARMRAGSSSAATSATQLGVGALALGDAGLERAASTAWAAASALRVTVPKIAPARTTMVSSA